MVFKFIVLAALVAVANAGAIGAPLSYAAPIGAPLAYSTGFAAPAVKSFSAGPAVYSAPAVYSSPAVYSAAVPQYAQYASYAAAPVVKAPVAYAASPVVKSFAPAFAPASLSAPLTYANYGYAAPVAHAAPLQYYH